MKSMNRITGMLALATAIMTLPVPGARAGATFTIIVLDGPTEGFNDPTPFSPVGGNFATTLGEARMNAFRRAADIWAACLVSPVPIEVEVQMDPMSCTTSAGVLGAAGTNTVHRNFTSAPIWDTWYPQALANSRAAYDLAPADTDIEATFNSDIGTAGCLATSEWYYGLDGNPPLGDIDFVTVALHELAHGLGVQTYVSLTTGVKFMGYDDGYERNLEGHFTVPNQYAVMSDAQRVAANTSDPDLHWLEAGVNAAGANLTAGVSNGHVRMHGPSTLVPGSSVNHFSNALSPNQVMEATYTGARHNPGIAANLLNDIGWVIENKSLEVCDDGAVVDVVISPPRNPISLGVGASNEEHGAYVTALKDFDVCAVAVEGDHFVGHPLTATIYEAAGQSRGAILATGAALVDFSGNHLHYIPITASLSACKDYDISVTVGGVFDVPVWPDFDPHYPVPAIPFDAAGVIRVRDGHVDGDPTVPHTPHLSLIGAVPAPADTADLTNPAIVWSVITDASTARGVYVTALKTARLCAVSFEADFPTYTFLDDLRANIYEAKGIIRGNLIATGVVRILGVGALATHTIPVNALLSEGADYDIEVVYPPATYSYYFEGPGPAPFDVDGVLRVVEGEQDGAAPDPYLPHLTVGYEEGAGGDTFDIVGPFHGPPGTSFAGSNDVGVFALAANNVDVNSIGWMADVPAGESFDVLVFESTGLARGTLLAQGSITSAATGMRWHDVPVSANLVAGVEYDLVVKMGIVNQWPWWDDTQTPVPPYNAYGSLVVLEGEMGGNAADPTLPQIRINTCRSTAVGVGGPATPPRFSLAAPYPNPASAAATIRFSLDEGSRVSVTVYDVLGRRVATLVDNASYPAGPAELAFDRGDLASGVYFVKLQTPTRSLSRRMVLVR
jgi:hypothetical protein